MPDKKKDNESLPSQEWSYFFDVEEVGLKVVKLSLSPNETEKKALSKRLKLSAIDDLKADLQLKRNSGNRVIHVTGLITARIKQKCIVTMEPVEETIEEEFEGWFADPHQAVSFTKAKRERMTHKDKEEQPMLEEFDDPEPIVGGKIDLGEFITQHFSLMINPYPRKAGAVYQGGEPEVLEKEAEGVYTNPFAALKDWKARERKKDN